MEMLSAAPLNPQAAEFTPGVKGRPMGFNAHQVHQGHPIRGYGPAGAWANNTARGSWGAPSSQSSSPAASTSSEESRNRSFGYSVHGRKLNPNAAPYGATATGVVVRSGKDEQQPNIPHTQHGGRGYDNNSQNTTIAGRVVEHKVYVSTPWYTKGVDKAVVQLSGEIEAFHEFMRLTPSEVSRRENALCAVRAVASRRYPRSAFHPYGSYSVGTAVASSALDVMLDNCGPLTAEYVKDTFSSVGTIKSLMCADEMTAFAQVESPSGVVVNMSLHKKVGSQAALAAVHLCREFFERHPNGRSAFDVLRQVMAQTGNLEVNTGGLSAYALVIMLVTLVTINPLCAATPGALLLQFCKYYGRDFPFGDYSLCVKRGMLPKRHTQEAISIIDPFEPEGNLAAGCTRTFQIQVQLQHCHSALLRWEGSATGDRKGYKGRTPLSGVISHQKLWGRSEMVQQEAEARTQGRAFVPAERVLPQAEPVGLDELRRTFSPSATSPSPAASLSSPPPEESKQEEADFLFPSPSPCNSPKVAEEPIVNMSFASEEVLDLMEGLNLNMCTAPVGGSNSSPGEPMVDVSSSPGQSLLELCLAGVTARPPQPSSSALPCTPGLTDSPVSCSLFDLATATPLREQFNNAPSDDSLDHVQDLEDDLLLRTIDAAISGGVE